MWLQVFLNSLTNSTTADLCNFEVIASAKCITNSLSTFLYKEIPLQLTLDLCHLAFTEYTSKTKYK